MKKTSKSLLIISALVLTASGTYAQNYQAGPYAFTGSGGNNTVVGGSAGNSGATGTFNSFFGYKAGSNLSYGTTNTFIGSSAGATNTSGGNNCYFGGNAASSLTNGNGNTIIGTNAGLNKTLGGSNCFFGMQAGTNLNGSGNICIGAYAGSQTSLNSTAINNQLFIGYGTSLGASSLIAGDFGAQTLAINGALTVNTTNGSPFVVKNTNISLLQIDGSGNLQSANNMVLNNTNYNGEGSPSPNNAQLLIRTTGGLSGADPNHGLGYVGTPTLNGKSVLIDGPVLYGYHGGALGYNTSSSVGNLSGIALLWNNNGQVGIGNTNPTAVLDVAGTNSSPSLFAVRNTSFINPTNTTYATTAFEVTTNGQVFIGAQRPTSTNLHASAILNVSGDLVVGNTGGSAGIYINQTNWADFVFDKNYTLMPLNEVESFYIENHHLPNVPTTKDIQAKGNNIGQTDAILLQKIEELTLYMVKQQKQIEELKKKIEQSKK